MRVLAVALILLAIAGCSTDPRARREIALMRNEILDLEDQYYSLKAKYRDETGHEPDFSSASGDGYSYTTEDSNTDGICAQCGQVHNPTIEYDHPLIYEPTIDSQSAPQSFPNSGGTIQRSPESNGKANQPRTQPAEEIELIPDAKSTGDSAIPTKGSSFNNRGSDLRRRSDARYRDARSDSAPLIAPPASVADIHLPAEEIAGYEVDGRPGDDGVLVSIVPDFGQSETGSLGDLTISVIDPEQATDKQRLGLWRFTAHQVDSMLVRNNGHSKIAARLPWQHGPVKHSNLLLFARLKTADGRLLERSIEFTAKVYSGTNEGDVVEPEIDLNTDDSEGFSTDPPITSPEKTSEKGRATWRPIR